jgi:Domain of unknown function (DUF4274)
MNAVARQLGQERSMGMSEERRDWIKRVANDAIFDELSERDFDAMTEDDHWRPFEEFFETVSDPEELHLFVGLINWDGGTKELTRVIQHPLCDLGTALMVYWLGQPGFDLQYASRDSVPQHRQEVYDLLREIEQRVAKGLYKSATQTFDPADVRGHDLRPKAERIKRYGRDLPAAMYRAVTAVAEGGRER